MPDWSYQPIFKPLLFRMPARAARDLTLAVTGSLAKFPLGPKILDFIGDMRPHPRLAVDAIGLQFASRAGLGAGLAFDSASIIAFSHFGLGHIEVGPVTVSPVVAGSKDIKREESTLSISYESVPENPGIAAVFPELETAYRFLEREDRGVRLGVRLANVPETTAEEARLQYIQLIDKLSPVSDFITIDTRWWQGSWTQTECAEIVRAAKQAVSKSTSKPLLLLVPNDCADDLLRKLLCEETLPLIDGVLISGGITGRAVSKGATPETAPKAELADKPRTFGRPCKTQSIELTQRVSKLLAGTGKAIVASGGILEPQDALDFLDAGASLVQLHSGFVFSGPGLAKRMNECIALRREELLRAPPIVSQKDPSKDLTQGWVGFTLVATGLIISSSTVIAVGLTRVLLPYDEAFLGVAMNDIPQINQNLLKFMAHDRVTLGGSSLSGAVLFFCLAIFGCRLRSKWAYVTEVAGLIAGFLAFFLYLGFKYFDPLHALVCVLVLPFFIWGVVRRPEPVPEVTTNLTNNPSWKRSQVGQLMFVLIGAGLLLAGITIAGVGCSTIFVREDLLFMDTTRDLLACHDHLLPLVAHDRASFGGCLWAVGIVELLTSLYGFRQGNRWVWWTLFLGGLPGFLAVIGIHFAIGYTHFVHLLPAYIAIVMYVVGLVCSYDYLANE